MRIDQKFELAARCLAPDVKTVLDVGCRDAAFRKHVPQRTTYVGLDLAEGPGVDVAANLETGLPFPDGSFDVVVALDVLEHTERIWFVFDELVRVARTQVMVLMPNLYHWRNRIQFLFGLEASKYALPSQPIVDRHRWLTSYRSARQFFFDKAREHQLETTEYVLHGGRRHVPIDMMLCTFSKNLGAWAVLHSMRKSAH
jgi:ubiquinone/menaquinone biosynthesis C-methylase UbiE